MAKSKQVQEEEATEVATVDEKSEKELELQAKVTELQDMLALAKQEIMDVKVSKNAVLTLRPVAAPKEVKEIRKHTVVTY